MSGLKAVVSEDGKEDGGVTFPSPNPKIGDKIKFGPDKRQRDATISMVEAASPVEERPAPTAPDETGDEHNDAESVTNAEPLKGQPDLPTLTNALPSPTTPGETAPIATEAVPVAAMLYAAEASDLNGFRNAYSSRIREGEEQANWEENLKEARDNVKRLLGNHKIDELTFTFTGNKENGEVSIVSKVKVLVTLKVIREGDKWKIDER